MLLDLTIRHFTRSVGNILVIGTWYRDDEMQWRSALVLVRAGDEKSGIEMPCVIPSNGAWVWSEAIGDPAQAARAAFAFCRALRLDGDPMNIPRLAGLINDHLPDLLKIPPLPPSDRYERSVAEGEIRDRTTGKAIEFEVRA